MCETQNEREIAASAIYFDYEHEANLKRLLSLYNNDRIFSRQLRWVISSCSLWETNGTVLSSLEDYQGVTHVISNGLHVISLFSCEI